MGQRTEKFDGILRDLQTVTPEVNASALVGVDGAMIASTLPPSVEKDRVAAMTAAMLSLGEKALRDLARGEMDYVYLKGKDGHILLTAIGDRTVLIQKVQEHAKMGLVHFEMKKINGKLTKVVEKTLASMQTRGESENETVRPQREPSEREVLLKKYGIRDPSEETIMAILRRSGLSVRDFSPRGEGEQCILYPETKI